jgi:hypothetical protein
MTQYVVILGVVFLCNVVPAFAPPTWIVLVFFSLNYQVPGWALVALGVIGATSGRLILASYFRRFRTKLPRSYITNMENASTHLTKSKGHAAALMLLFLFSPLSSAQLFEAAGIMRRIPLLPICGAFAAGRIVTYSSYVYGSKAIQATSLGELITRNITSGQAIALQIAMIVGLVLLGTIKWQPHHKLNESTTSH